MRVKDNTRFIFDQSVVIEEMERYCNRYKIKLSDFYQEVGFTRQSWRAFTTRDIIYINVDQICKIAEALGMPEAQTLMVVKKIF